jgi:predicted nucleic acid-binding Zn ribbon protein
MRKSNQQTIGEVLQQFLKENKLDIKLNQANIIGNWEKLVGPLFSKHTKQLYFSGSRLFLEIDSPAVRNELIMQKSNLLEKINEWLDGELITEIIIK